MDTSFLSVLAEPAIFPFACAIFGLLVGSFLNVVIYRLPIMMERDWKMQVLEAEQNESANESANTIETLPPFSLTRPRSRCSSCGHEISALENIPVISWLLLGGKCKACKAKISMRYPAVELLTAVLCGIAGAYFGYGLAALGALLLTFTLITLTFIDMDTFLLPDSLTLPLIWLGLLFNLNGSFVDLESAVIGAMAGYLTLWSIYWAFKLLTGKEGMGYGDFKLLAALGAWFGWQMLPAIILLSSAVGAMIGVGLIVLAKRGKQIPMSFGPYLAIAGLIALYYGNAINNWYLATMF